MAIISDSSMSKSEDVWLPKAVDFAFRCNLVGNCLGWGTLLCLLLPPFQVFVFGLGLMVLPLAVPFILLVNVVVGCMVLGTRVKQGSLPEFNKPEAYFIQGTISTTLFFIGSALYETLYWIVMSASMNSPD